MFKIVKRNEKGFTLIELMIVIAIIGILAAIAIPQFAAYRLRGYNSSAQSDVRNLATSEAAFFSDWQMFGSTNIAGAGTMITGPDPAAAIFGTDAGAVARTLLIPVGNGIGIIALDDAALGTTFNAVSKHRQGDTYYGYDSDSTAVYMQQVAADTGILTNVAANCPAAAINTVDFAAPWVIK